MPLAIKDVSVTVGEIQKSFLYKFVIDSMPPGLVIKYPEYAAEATNFSEIVDLYNMKGFVPKRSTAGYKLQWAGETIYLPTVDETDKKFTLSFLGGEDGRAFQFWSRIKDLSGDPISHAGLPGPMRMMSFSIFTIGIDKTSVTQRYRVTDAWISGVEWQSDADKSGDSPVLLQVSGFFTYVDSYASWSQPTI